MSIILKHTIRNIMKKPLRTFLLIFCIFLCSFTALMCLDMKGAVGDLIRGTMTQVVGNSDLVVSNPNGLTDEILDFGEQTDYVLVREILSGRPKMIDGQYTYFHQDTFIVYGMDTEAALRMRLITQQTMLEADEIAISTKMQREFGWDVGDTVTLTGQYGEEFEFTIKQILPAQGIMNAGLAACIGSEGVMQLSGDRAVKYESAYVDIVNSENYDEIVNSIKSRDFRAEVESVLDNEMLNEAISEITRIFFIMFTICFLLVIFVTASVSSRIICERMSVVGTFRSIGLSTSMTSFFLFLENGLYGLCGGILACLLYKAVRNSLLGSVFVMETNGIDVTAQYGTTSFWVYLIVIIGAVIVECICPLRKILGTSAISIRDIIFDNKDTIYQVNRPLTITGAALAGVGVITFCLGNTFLWLIICFLSIVFSVALLHPIIMKGITGGLSRFFGSHDKPILRLAFMECYARKSTVGSAILCVTVSLLAVILFIIVESAGDIFNSQPYDCDLHVTSLSEKSAMFTYIQDLEGVTDTETIYQCNVYVGMTEGENVAINVFGMPQEGIRHLVGLKNLPDTLADDEVVMDRRIADRYGWEIGDSITLQFNQDTFLPVTRTLLLKGYCDSYAYDTIGESIVISQKTYVDIFHDYPGEILVCTNEPEAIKKKIENYSGYLNCTVETMEEFSQMRDEKSAGIKGVLLMVIIMGIGLTVIGMASNQIIGFEGRRRECAVMISSVMSKANLSKVFFIESAVSVGISLIVAFILSFPLLSVLRKLFNTIAGNYPIENHPITSLKFLVVIWFVFTLVSLFPISKLKKMKLAEVLKYE